MNVVQRVKDSLRADSQSLMCFRDLKHRVRALGAARVWAAEALIELSISRKQNAPSRILLLCHSLEKGMSNPTPRQGFGVPKARTLIDEMVEWRAREGDPVTRSFEWMEAAAILNSYLAMPTNKDATAVRELASRFAAEVGSVARPAQLLPAGVQVLPSPELPPKAMDAFRAFLGSRHSVRYFSDEPVAEATILDAIEMAGLSPSACNRQPTRVYYSTSPELNAQIGNLVPGNAPSRGHIPNYLVLTYDRRFFEPYETYQWHINAGIFAGYLSLSLHAHRVGSCMYQWPVASRSEREMSRLLGIRNKSESIALVIGCGHYLEANFCTLAARRPVSDLAIRVD